MSRYLNNQILWRILGDVGLLCSVFILPWWITLIIAIVLLVQLNAYEVVLAGVLLDALFAAPTALWLGIEFVFTIALVFIAFAWYLIAPYLFT